MSTPSRRSDDLQAAAARLVDREVHYCVSSLVSTIAQGYGSLDSSTAELSDAAEQAFELCTPILDFEEAAREAGWTSLGRTAENDLSSLMQFDHEEHGAEFAHDWEDLCYDCGIEPNEREVFEHWIVSDWLADKLAEHGEKVDKDFCGLTVWARTTTGRGIASDHVIEQIVQAAGYAMGAA